MFLMRGLLVAVGRCNTQVRLSLIYVPGQPPRPPVPWDPLRNVLRSVTHKQDARIVDKVYCWMLQSSKLLSVFKPDTLSGVLTLFNDHNLSYSRTSSRRSIPKNSRRSLVVNLMLKRVYQLKYLGYLKLIGSDYN